MVNNGLGRERGGMILGGAGVVEVGAGKVRE